LDETIYPVMQGYDSWFLDTDLQLGGTEFFNEIVRIHLVWQNGEGNIFSGIYQRQSNFRNAFSGANAGGVAIKTNYNVIGG
jgi:hypothetical protein